MTDELSTQGEPDRSRIMMTDSYEVKHWTEKFGVSKEDLQRAVDKVGSSAGAVEQHLREWKLLTEPE